MKMSTKSDKSDKEVVLGVTGSIAAYKACEIASRLVKAGIKVTPVLTRAARELVGAASFEALTGNAVITEMFVPLQNQEIEHIAVARRADLFLIAPATANVLAKAAHGIADDWLTTTLLATPAPVLFAPAMNTNMYNHVATQANIGLLKSRGCHFIGPVSGTLACKTVGLGAMEAPRLIVERALALINRRDDLAGRKVLLTSGANHEPIDPVRFLGNRSSGKMGHAIAAEALQRGASVTVVMGPAEVQPPPGAEVIPVQTALEMCEAVMERAAEADIIIGAAAVADYRVENPASQKLKRNGQDLSLKLVENPDIMARVGSAKAEGQILVGFAAETDDLIENAKAKLQKKGLHLIVANEVGGKDSGFGTDTVKASFLDRKGGVEDHSLLTKDELAEKLFDRIVSMMG